MTAEVKDLTPAGALALEALAEVLEVLIRLHDREVDVDFLRGAAEHQIAGWIGGEMTGPEGKRAAAALGRFLRLPLRESTCSSVPYRPRIGPRRQWAATGCGRFVYRPPGAIAPRPTA